MELTAEQLQELSKVQYLSIEDTKAEKIKEERRIIHFISTPDLDRGRDIMMPLGMQSDEFDKTKTFFADHNYSKPIGKNVKLSRTKDGVKATSYFSTEEYANDRYLMHLEGVLNGWSIGFAPMRDSKGMIKDGSIEWDDKKNIRTFHEWKLQEYSDTGIPMNTDCIDLAKNICKSAEMKTEIETVEFKMFINKSLEDKQNEINELKTLIEQLKSGGNNDELKNEIKNLKSQLEKFLGNENKKADEALIRRQVRSALVGSFEELTGRKYKN